MTNSHVELIWSRGASGCSARSRSIARHGATLTLSAEWPGFGMNRAAPRRKARRAPHLREKQ
jgi:hypothetical protein